MTLYSFRRLNVAFDISSIFVCGRNAIITVGSSFSPINLELNSAFLHILSIRFINTLLSGYSLSGIPNLDFFPNIRYHGLRASSLF